MPRKKTVLPEPEFQDSDVGETQQYPEGESPAVQEGEASWMEAAEMAETADSGPGELPPEKSDYESILQAMESAAPVEETPLMLDSGAEQVYEPAASASAYSTSTAESGGEAPRPAPALAVGVFQACGMGKKALTFAVLRKLVLEIPALIVWNRLWPLYGLAYTQVTAEIILAVAAIITLRSILQKMERTASSVKLR